MKKKLLTVLFCALMMITASSFAQEAQPVRVDGYQFRLSAENIFYGMPLKNAKIHAEGSTVSINGKDAPADKLGDFIFVRENDVLPVGKHTVTVRFVPHDPALDGGKFSDEQVDVQVLKAVPQINNYPQAMPLDYGESLAQSSLVGGSAMNPYNGKKVWGEFKWEWPDTVPGVGEHRLSALFVPVGNDADLYESMQVQVKVKVAQRKVTVTAWPQVQGKISFGQPLSVLTLNGGEAQDENGNPLRGTFVWRNEKQCPDVGNQTAVMLFKPMDYVNYETVTGKTDITVEKASLTLKAEDMTLPYGTALGQVQPKGTAADAQGQTVEGVWRYEKENLIPEANEQGNLCDVTFVPKDEKHYQQGMTQGKVWVTPAKVEVRPLENKKYLGCPDGEILYEASLPDQVTLTGKLSREPGEAVGQYGILQGSLALSGEKAKNYTLTVENGMYFIEYYPVSGSVSLSVPLSEQENGWYNQWHQLKIVPPAGYLISLSEKGSFEAQLAAPQSAQGVQCFLQKAEGENKGALTAPVRVDYRLDDTPPQARMTLLVGHRFMVDVSDNLSGIRKVYTLWDEETTYFDSALRTGVEKYAREAHPYTFVIYDAAGNSTTYSVDFDDTDKDGLIDIYEEEMGTDPLLKDTDGDGVDDFTAREIGMLLERKHLDVESALLTGGDFDGAKGKAVYPEEGNNLLVPAELCTVSDWEKPLSGVVRLGGGQVFDVQAGQIFSQKKGEKAVCLVWPSQGEKVAVTSAAPHDVMLFSCYDTENNCTLENIKLFVPQQKICWEIPDTQGVQRFDLSSDGKMMAWTKDKQIYIADLETGRKWHLRGENPAVFYFENEKTLQMDNTRIVWEKGRWEKHENVLPARLVFDLSQPLTDERTVYIGDGKEIRVGMRVRGQAELTEEGILLSCQSAAAEAEEGNNWQALKDLLAEKPLGEKRQRAVEFDAF